MNSFLLDLGRNQDGGAIWFWAILLFAVAGILGYFAMQSLQPHLRHE